MTIFTERHTRSNKQRLYISKLAIMADLSKKHEKVPLNPLLPLEFLHPSDFTSSSLMKRTTEPRVIRQSTHLEEKLAAGFASLYDAVEDTITMKLPIFKRDSMEVKPHTKVIDLCPPGSSCPASSNSASPVNWTRLESMDMTLSDSPSADGMDVDDIAPSARAIAIANIRSEWVGTSQFFIERNVEWQRNVCRNWPLPSTATMLTSPEGYV